MASIIDSGKWDKESSAIITKNSFSVWWTITRWWFLSLVVSEVVTASNHSKNQANDNADEPNHSSNAKLLTSKSKTHSNFACQYRNRIRRREQCRLLGRTVRTGGANVAAAFGSQQNVIGTSPFSTLEKSLSSSDGETSSWNRRCFCPSTWYSWYYETRPRIS
jgi:hypothetical protein